MIENKVKSNEAVNANISGSFYASNEEILRECEAVEIERLFMYESAFFANYKLCSRVYDRVMVRFNSHLFGLAGVFFMGYIYGDPG